MKVGWFLPLNQAASVERAGLDFIEPPLAPMNLENGDALKRALLEVDHCLVAMDCFGDLLPPHIRVVGPDVDRARVKSYFGRVAEVLSRANAKIVVYGSGVARNLPDSFERARGEDQFLESVNWLADATEGTEVAVAIEPVNRKKSNLINSVAEAVSFARRIDRRNVRVLADFYHMDEEREPLTVLQDYTHWLCHIHVADTGRRNPGTGNYDYQSFANYLRAGSYSGRVCVECVDFSSPGDIDSSVPFLRKIWPKQ